MFDDVEGNDPTPSTGEEQSGTYAEAPKERAIADVDPPFEGRPKRPIPALEELIEAEERSLQQIAAEQRVAVARMDAEIRRTEAEIELTLQRERLERHRQEVKNATLLAPAGVASHTGTSTLAAAAGAAGIGSLFGPAGAAIGACLGVLTSLALKLRTDTSRPR